MLIRLWPALIIALLIPHTALAAKFEFSQTGDQPKGTKQDVLVVLDTENKAINTIEASILVGGGGKVVGINGTDQTIALWLLRPTVFDRSDGNQEIQFIGSSPGGLTGSNIILFRFTVENINENSTLSWIKTKTLLHDGLGTETPSQGKQLNLVVPDPANQSVGSPTPQSGLTDPDTTPPQLISLVRVKDRAIYGGKWILVFGAKDLESGVAKYEIQETNESSPNDKAWQTAESPYLLNDQNGRLTAFLKVTNHAGQSSVFSLAPTTSSIVWSGWVKAVIVIVGLFLLTLLVWLWKKLKHHTPHEPMAL